MSNLENDLNPDVFIGIALPLEYGINGFFNKTRTTLQQVKYNIQNLLLTQKGERLGNPEFGSNLMKVVFEPDNGDTEALIEEEIRAAISNGLPFVNVVDVKTEFDQYNRNRLNVKINFSVNTNSVEEVNLNLGSEAPFGKYDVGGEGYRGEFDENTNQFS
tara:strand:+ start:243 stop:722 length:480 start_codon:yes stop_codon:yes gene_type:complete